MAEVSTLHRCRAGTASSAKPSGADILTGIEKRDTIDEKKVPRIIERMQNDGRIHRSKAISHEAEAERGNEYEQ